MIKYLDNWTFKHYDVAKCVLLLFGCGCIVKLWTLSKTFVLGSSHPVPPSPPPQNFLLPGLNLFTCECSQVPSHNIPNWNIYDTALFWSSALTFGSRAKTSLFRRQQCRRPLPQNMRSGLGGTSLFPCGKLERFLSRWLKGDGIWGGD